MIGSPTVSTTPLIPAAVGLATASALADRRKTGRGGPAPENPFPYPSWCNPDLFGCDRRGIKPLGLCRAIPPTINPDAIGDSNAAWPVVEADDWCREHRRYRGERGEAA